MDELTALREVNDAALKYDQAIRKRIVDGAVQIVKTGGAVAMGDDLDFLYMDLMNKACRAARCRRAAIANSEPVDEHTDIGGEGG